jgi:hypothetical protein
MDIKELARHAIISKIEACNDQYEVWKEDHAFAKLVFDCDDLLDDLVETYESIDSLHRDFVDRVTENSRTYSASADEAIHDLCRKWLDLARRVKTNLLDAYKSEGYSFDHETPFTEKLKLAEESEAVGFDVYARQKFEEFMPSFDKLNSVPFQ